MTTLRQLQEAIQERHAPGIVTHIAGDLTPYHSCVWCGSRWPCVDHDAAFASLKILNESERSWFDPIAKTSYVDSAAGDPSALYPHLEGPWRAIADFDAEPPA